MTWPNPNTHPEYYDPFASADRHPQLPAGYNADAFNGDMINGSGTNWEIWPEVFDSYEPFVPIVMTEEFQEVFDGCADYVVPAVDRLYVLPGEQRLYVIGGSWADVVPPKVNNIIVFPRETRTQKIKKYSSIVMVPGHSETIVLARETRGLEVKKS